MFKVFLTDGKFMVLIWTSGGLYPTLTSRPPCSHLCSFISPFLLLFWLSESGPIWRLPLPLLGQGPQISFILQVNCDWLAGVTWSWIWGVWAWGLISDVCHRCGFRMWGLVFQVFTVSLILFSFSFNPWAKMLRGPQGSPTWLFYLRLQFRRSKTKLFVSFKSIPPSDHTDQPPWDFLGLTFLVHSWGHHLSLGP